MPRTLDLKEAVRTLRAFYQRTRRAPSYDEIRELFHYRSKNAAFWLVKKLTEKGLISKDPDGCLRLDPLCGIKLLGTVQAGFPSAAEEELVDTLSLDEFLIRHPEQSYLVKVTGDSMIDAGIQPGDLVIVERGRTPKDNDIVIAEVDGEWTMKYYEKTGSQVTLRAANKKYKPIIPRDELKIGGVIVAVIRKYR